MTASPSRASARSILKCSASSLAHRWRARQPAAAGARSTKVHLHAPRAALTPAAGRAALSAHAGSKNEHTRLTKNEGRERGARGRSANAIENCELHVRRLRGHEICAPLQIHSLKSAAGSGSREATRAISRVQRAVPSVLPLLSSRLSCRRASAVKVAGFRPRPRERVALTARFSAAATIAKTVGVLRLTVAVSCVG